MITREEAVQLGAVDSLFYSRHFFPKAFRSEPALFHPEVWERLEDPRTRYMALKIARDCAKTTILRCFASKRIAYGISRTILFVGKSETAAMKSIDWLQRAVLYNHAWAQTFGLSKGKQWSGSEIDVYNAVLKINIRILAIGITGSTRGINIDDFRPDLIIVDDPCDEENTATPEQREKISELFFGSLYNSLAPRADQPEAKMALLQTPLDGEDLIEQCCKDSHWATAAFPILDENGNSTWPARYPTKELQHEKQGFIDRGKLATWMREKEVKITDDSTTMFRKGWLRYWGSEPSDEILPEGGTNYLAIDPTPPPKETSKVSSQKAAKLDDFVILAFKVYKGHFYLLEAWAAKSPNPQEWINKVFELRQTYRARRVIVETILFARMVKYTLETAMRERAEYFQVWPVEDKRKKTTRIDTEISGLASSRSLVVHRSMRSFIEQYSTYPVVNHDDYLDALAIGCMGIIRGLQDDDDPGAPRNSVTELEEHRQLRRAP
jgi:hypothetical protein